ncbi:MAG: hypothetical protein R2710_26075 [Acidimicrobiales bacterium]
MSKHMIQVFIGTKAQYIKTAPLLRLMDERGVDYTLIDSGQHADIARTMRQELGVREPDVIIADDGDISTIPDAIRWAARLSTRLVRASKLRDEVFGGAGGICSGARRHPVDTAVGTHGLACRAPGRSWRPGCGRAICSTLSPRN